MREENTRFLDSFLVCAEKYYYIILSAIFVIAAFNLFYYLGETPIYSWDEARHGISAYEMLRTKELIVNTYAYQNDYWNLKPPLSFWAIMIGYKLAGFNPLGLRLYSAVAALATILIIALFSKYKNGRTASLITALVLTTTPQYIVIHCARTGDADSLFVFFFTISMISMILIERNIKWLYLAGFAFSLAFMTKGWHSFNIIIIGFIYLLASKTIFKLNTKKWALFIASSFSLIIIWGILRYLKDGTAFFRMMISYDLLARTSKPLEGHIGDYWYYFNLLKEKYALWMSVFGFGLVSYLTLYSYKLYKENLDEKRKNYILAMLLWILVPIITFTIAKTKITWYIQAVYPAFAISIGALCGSLIRGEKRNVLMQLAVAAFIVITANKYEGVINKHILMFKNDNARVTFNNFEGLKDFKGVKAYIICGTSESEQIHWRQSDMLTAELYGDLIPQFGGVEGFIKDNDSKAILIIPKKDQYTNIIKKYNLKIISQSNLVYILRK